MNARSRIRFLAERRQEEQTMNTRAEATEHTRPAPLMSRVSRQLTSGRLELLSLGFLLLLQAIAASPSSADDDCGEVLNPELRSSIMREYSHSVETHFHEHVCTEEFRSMTDDMGASGGVTIPIPNSDIIVGGHGDYDQKRLRQVYRKNCKKTDQSFRQEDFEYLVTTFAPQAMFDAWLECKKRNPPIGINVKVEEISNDEFVYTAWWEMPYLAPDPRVTSFTVRGGTCKSGKQLRRPDNARIQAKPPLQKLSPRRQTIWCQREDAHAPVTIIMNTTQGASTKVIGGADRCSYGFRPEQPSCTRWEDGFCTRCEWTSDDLKPSGVARLRLSWGPNGPHNNFDPPVCHRMKPGARARVSAAGVSWCATPGCESDWVVVAGFWSNGVDHGEVRSFSLRNQLYFDLAFQGESTVDSDGEVELRLHNKESRRFPSIPEDMFIDDEFAFVIETQPDCD